MVYCFHIGLGFKNPGRSLRELTKQGTFLSFFRVVGELAFTGHLPSASHGAGWAHVGSSFQTPWQSCEITVISPEVAQLGYGRGRP